jgi:RNA-directed DNA polymerase
VAQRINDDEVLHLLKIMLKANGKRGVPQGGVISPVLSNLYLNEVDRMLERAKERTRNGKYIHIEYARFADDMVILINAHPRHDWLLKAVDKRLREELAKLHVQIKPYGRPGPWRELDRRRHKAHSQPPTCLPPQGG